MALSAQEKADVIYFLGWPGLTLVEGSTDYSQILVNRLTNVSTQMEVQVRSLLERLASIDVKLTSSTSRMLAKRVGDIELRDGETDLLRKERRMLLKQLSALLSIPLMGGGGVNIGVCC